MYKNMLSEFDKQFKNISTELKNYPDKESKKTVTEIYVTLDDVFAEIDSRNDTNYTNLLVDAITKQFEKNVKESKSYKEYTKYRLENIVYYFTCAYAYIHQYKLYLQSGVKDSTYYTQTMNRALRYIQDIRHFFYDQKYLRKHNRTENEESVLLLEWIINRNEEVNYENSTYRARIGDVYGVLKYLNHTFKDANIKGLLIEFGVFRSNLQGVQNLVSRNRYKLYKGNYNKDSIMTIEVEGRGIYIEDIFADAMGKISHLILAKVISEASKNKVITGKTMEQITKSNIWRGSQALILSCQLVDKHFIKTTDGKKAISANFSFKIARLN